MDFAHFLVLSRYTLPLLTCNVPVFLGVLHGASPSRQKDSHKGVEPVVLPPCLLPPIQPWNGPGVQAGMYLVGRCSSSFQVASRLPEYVLRTARYVECVRSTFDLLGTNKTALFPLFPSCCDQKLSFSTYPETDLPTNSPPSSSQTNLLDFFKKRIYLFHCPEPPIST